MILERERKLVRIMHIIDFLTVQQNEINIKNKTLRYAARRKWYRRGADRKKDINKYQKLIGKQTKQKVYLKTVILKVKNNQMYNRFHVRAFKRKLRNTQ